MKKILLFFLVLSCLGCDKEDPAAKEAGKPSVESVIFAEVFSGSQSNTKIFVKLNIPEEGSVKSVSLIRNTTRINGAISSPKNGTNTIVDPIEFPSGTVQRSYSFVLIMQDNTEITSTQYQVK